MPREWQSDQRYIERRDPRMADRQHDADVRIDRRDERMHAMPPMGHRAAVSMHRGLQWAQRNGEAARGD